MIRKNHMQSKRAKKRAAKWRLSGMIKTSSGCKDCGYNTSPYALQFDHTGDDKKDSVSNLIRSDYSWSTIKTEILKCEVQSRTGLEEIDYLFNSNIGNTIELNILTKWNITNFDAVIGNPPYEDTDATGDNKLYLEFTKYA